MADTATFLFELGTEELPPGSLLKLSQALETHFTQQLQKAELQHGDVKVFAAPRRLALKIEQLALKQPDRVVEKRGPALNAAYQADGTPSKAALGFAKSCGAEFGQLQTLKTDKGEWLAYNQEVAGADSASLIPEMIRQSLAALPIAKRMRWGSSESEFVRPVHWCVLMLDGQVIDAEILDVKTGNSSFGHRFHHPAAVNLSHANDYAEALGNAHVIADFAERRQSIEKQANEAAGKLGGIAVIDEELLDEITALNEWPVAITGSFDERYLALPSEALITTMQINQKYFPVVNAKGELLASFITFSNIASKNPDAVRDGNQRVIRPRLADAEFFWQQDRKQSLEARTDILKNIVFQNKLGSIAEKSERVAQLSAHIASQLGQESAAVKRAALLAKTDLVTEMVGEFPSLQGVMGRYYAQADGESDDIALAIEEQYWPKKAGGELPNTVTGQILALAEKVDTVISIFSAGLIPTGDKDPYALRRAALGALRILIEKQLDLDLEELINKALSSIPDSVFQNPETKPGLGLDTVLAHNAKHSLTPGVLEFFNDRLRGYCCQELGYKTDEFDAVAAVCPTRPLDFINRLKAVRVFSQLPEAISLSAANKRIGNILKKSEAETIVAIDPARFQESQENALHATLQNAVATVEPLLAESRYEEILKALAQFRDPVDAFFDGVMVNAEDPDLRRNRISLLASISDLFMQVADISRLQADASAA